MNVNFNHEEAGPITPIYFEQVYAEKPGGGRVANPTRDFPPATAVYLNSNGLYEPVRGFRLVEGVKISDTSIKVAKECVIAVGDVVGFGSKAVAVTAVDNSKADYDVATVTMGVAIPNGTTLYEAKAASTDSAEVKATPQYVTYQKVYADKGDQLIRLVNGANLRKETANIADEVAALLPTIAKV